MPETVNPETISIWVQYANVFIPLAISLLGAFATLMIYKEKVRRLEKDVEEVKKNLQETRDKAIANEATLKANEPLVKRESPISLTDTGRNFLEESGGINFIDDNFEDLLIKVEARNPKTAYDIQEQSREILESMQDDDKFNPLKDYLYKEGREINDLILVMGIDLRDKILIKKEWNVEDIDKYDPKKKTAEKE